MANAVRLMRDQRPSADDWRDRLGPLAREAAAQAREHAPKAAATLEQIGHDLAARARDHLRRHQEAKALAPRRTRLLWLLPLPLLPAAALSLASGDLAGFAAAGGAYGLLLGGSFLARSAMEDEARQRRRTVSSGRRLPLKLLAWLTVGVGTALAAWMGAGHEVVVAGVFGLGAAGGCALLYGLDARPPAVDLTGAASTDQREALARAEGQIIAIENAAADLPAGELTARLARITVLARGILAEMAGDARDFRRARRFLVTYLDGAEQVVTGYAARHDHARGGELEGNFRRVLVTIEEVFQQQRQRLLDSDLRDLDVQIEVLETQLRHEGLDRTRGSS